LRLVCRPVHRAPHVGTRERSWSHQRRYAAYRSATGAQAPGDAGIEYATVGPTTCRRYLREQPEQTERFLSASAEAVALTFNAPEPTLAVLGRYTSMDDRELLEETLAAELSRTPRDMLPTPAGLRAAMDELIATIPKAATADPAAFVDLTIPQRLNDSGFIASLYR
jgi:hypothetical protein